MDALQPPMPPQVAQQQTPMMQYAQGGGGQMASAQQAVNQTPSMDLVSQILGSIADNLNKVATILSTERPELVALLKPVVQGLAMIESNIKTAQGGAPTGGDQGTAQPSGAPDAPGPAAMGMGQ